MTARPLRNRFLGALITAIILAIFLLLLLALRAVSSESGTKDAPDYAVARREMNIAVTQPGTLESQEDVQIVCEVDDLQGDSVDGTRILWIVPNGAMVKRGDLLVELDAAQLLERLDNQVLAADQARAAQVQAQARYENQLSLNETAEADAQLNVELAELELKMFTDAKSGTCRLEVDEIRREIDDLNNEILAVQAAMQLKRNTQVGTESLFKMGYAGKSELDRTRLDLLQAENQYTTKLNQRQTLLASLERKQTYEHEMRLLRLQGNLESTRRNCRQVARDDQARLAQAKAAVDAADLALEKQQERLARYQQQLARCKIVAPQDGMVVYARPSDSSGQAVIGPGTRVHQRQPILSLAAGTTDPVRTSVPETVATRISCRVPAVVQLAAAPQRTDSGKVGSVATPARSSVAARSGDEQNGRDRH